MKSALHVALKNLLMKGEAHSDAKLMRHAASKKNLHISPGAGACPDCGAQMVDGKCPECGDEGGNSELAALLEHGSKE